MFQSAPDDTTRSRRRFGLAEALLVVGILAFGGFTLVADGRQTVEGLLSGLHDTLSR